MSVARRLTKIETSLTPKQAVLLWLKEVQQLDINSFREKLIKSPMDEDPHVRVPVMAARAVRESLGKRDVTSGSAKQAELEAWKQAAFLVALAMRLHEMQLSEFQWSEDRIVLLAVCWHGMALASNNCAPCDRAEWIAWEMLLVETLARMWRLRDTIAEISKNYYDGHSLLLPEAESELKQRIRVAEALATTYNTIAGNPPSWTRIDLAGLQSSIKALVPAAVDEQVAFANAKVLQMLGQPKAAWAYALASVERRRSAVAGAVDEARQLLHHAGKTS